MKRIIKATVSLLTVLAVLMSLALPIVAADSSVTYNGRENGFEFSPGSEYSATDLFDNFKGIMPGETRTQIINITNNSDDSDYIKLYIRAELHDEAENPLSEGVAATGVTIATMNEFLAQLSMTVKLGGTAGEVIYNASPDELDGFAENVYLGSFRKGEKTSLAVELLVPSDLGNEFQYLVGEVDWIFVAELFDDPAPPPTNNTVLTVRKQWVDDGQGRPESIKAELLRNGEYYAETVLSEANQWTYTWSGLEDADKWTVREADVPEGYSVSYKTEGNIATIINTKDEVPAPPVKEEPVTLTVKKEWSGDEDSLKNRPDSAKMTLYNGTTAVETVVLDEKNGWTFTWKGLEADGDWNVLEVDIPKGYSPVYSVEDGVVTVTNVATLVQTGQLKWPVAVLSGVGVIMILFGGAMIARKRKRESA